MSPSNLLKLAGLAALLGAALLIIVGLTQLVLNLLLTGSGTVSETVMGALYVQSGFGLLGRALVALGLIGLYVRQSEATNVLGLVSFLVTFLGLALPVGFEWSTIFANLGWALFGVVSLRARVYSQGATMLLIVGAIATGVFSNLLVAPTVGGLGSILMYVGVGAEIVRNVAVGWLGYALFFRRGFASERVSS